MAKIDFVDLIDKLDDESDRAALADLEEQRALFLKYAVRVGGWPDKREQLLKDYKAGASLTGPKGLRRKLGAIDLEYFGRSYLGHYFTRPAPAFHAELDEIWFRGVMKGLDPTEHAKEISRAKGCRRAIPARGSLRLQALHHHPVGLFGAG